MSLLGDGRAAGRLPSASSDGGQAAFGCGRRRAHADRPGSGRDRSAPRAERKPGGEPSLAQGVVYFGPADWWGRHAWVERDGVRASLPYCREPALAFAWGRPGLGARELARSILHHATSSSEVAERLCTTFARDVIAELPDIGFSLDREEILAWAHGRI